MTLTFVALRSALFAGVLPDDWLRGGPYRCAQPHVYRWGTPPFGFRPVPAVALSLVGLWPSAA
jgi:hypothetical protein